MIENCTMYIIGPLPCRQSSSDHSDVSLSVLRDGDTTHYSTTANVLYSIYPRLRLPQPRIPPSHVQLTIILNCRRFYRVLVLRTQLTRRSQTCRLLSGIDVTSVRGTGSADSVDDALYTYRPKLAFITSAIGGIAIRRVHMCSQGGGGG